ncbi:MAG: NADPH-dependent 7-cyano-7-deazaguanine reductase QueF [Acidimicrobiia bacterium]
MPTTPSRELEAITNPETKRDYVVELECPEFTCVCPRTGQPDFAVVRIAYVPGPKLVELKSLKLYLWSFRDEGHYHEEVTNTILSDLVAAVEPKRMIVEAEFNIRGGIKTVVRAVYPDEEVLESLQ